MFLQFAPGPLKLTPDQVAMLQSDNVVSDAAKGRGATLEGPRHHARFMEAVAPQYLWRFRAAGSFSARTRKRFVGWAKARLRRAHHAHRARDGGTRSLSSGAHSRDRWLCPPYGF
jgi:hypothetical protein